jgi:hypothetical protein
MEKPANKTIPVELLAAFLDGNATAYESDCILQSLAEDAQLRELMRISLSVDKELGWNSPCMEVLPMTALAANCQESNCCALECEKYVMSLMGLPFDEQQLMTDAQRNGWLKDNGTALHNVGRHLEGKGIIVKRQYKCTVEDIAAALEAGNYLIVAVDGGELTGNPEEFREDVFSGQIPDHTVVVLNCDIAQGKITVFDPYSPDTENVCTIGQFEDAWADSKNYLVTVISENMSTYIPKPIDLSDVELTEDLNELREAIAENAHEIWAENRQKEGWTYGPERNDELKQNPDMVPYSQLPEGEKEYDREMAMKTIKLLLKLGYDIIKREDTELYQVLKKRIQNSEEQYFCRSCGKPIYKYQVFCDHCGFKLDMDWNQK